MKIYSGDSLLVLEIDQVNSFTPANKLYIKQTIYFDIQSNYVDCENHRNFDSIKNFKIIGSSLYVKVARAVFLKLINLHNRLMSTSFQLWKDLRSIPRYYVEEAIQAHLDACNCIAIIFHKPPVASQTPLIGFKGGFRFYNTKPKKFYNNIKNTKISVNGNYLHYDTDDGDMHGTCVWSKQCANWNKYRYL
jgi:hypothetical protein